MIHKRLFLFLLRLAEAMAQVAGAPARMATEPEPVPAFKISKDEFEPVGPNTQNEARLAGRRRRSCLIQSHSE